MDRPKFITGKPAMLVGKDLVIADLHLGIEREFYKSGIKFPSQTGKVRGLLDGIIEETKPARLIILGDVKHKVPGISLQEMREIPEFLRYFSRKLDVGIVPGNHDAGIEKFAPHGVRIHPATGLRLAGIFLNHGHTWPDPEFMQCGTIVLGHQHPLIEFKDKLMYRFMEPVWVKGGLDRSKIVARYKNVPSSLPSVVIMPAFNGMAGGIAINSSSESKSVEDFIGPVLRSMDKKTVSVHLLDGTYLGRLKDLPGAKI
jgi:putative SbcD/Mre11-related phosphoesterase